MRKLKVQEKLEAQVNRLVLTKDQRLEDECLKPQYQPPCKPGQVNYYSRCQKWNMPDHFLVARLRPGSHV